MAKILTYKILFIFILSLIGCGNMFTKNKTKFDWLASESAPKNYPMRIINGTFYYHKEEGGLYIPTAASINPGWGNFRSSHVVGDDFKALPDRVDIRFFSFTESKLYQGSFDLPYDKILAFFKEGVARNKEMPIFRYIVVGVAPGGAVSVWVKGRGETREVFFGQAEPYENEIQTPLGSTITDRADYVRESLEGDLSAQTLADIDKNGVPLGLWASYRQPYRWQVKFTQENIQNYIAFSFFNGESYHLNYPFSESDIAQPRPLPLLISFGALIKGETMQDFMVTRFNDKELYAAFEKLGANNELVTIEIEPHLPKKNTKLRLYNSKKTIEFTGYSTDD